MMFSAGVLVGGIIGLLVGALIAAVLILLGSRIVMGASVTFGSAFLAALASSVAGFVVGAIAGFVVGAISPNALQLVPPFAFLLGLIVTLFIYQTLLKTHDGRKPSFVQAVLIYLIQLAVIAVVVGVLVYVLHVPVPIPGLPAAG